jgi:hypothetical protein
VALVAEHKRRVGPFWGSSRFSCKYMCTKRKRVAGQRPRRFAPPGRAIESFQRVAMRLRLNWTYFFVWPTARCYLGRSPSAGQAPRPGNRSSRQLRFCACLGCRQHFHVHRAWASIVLSWLEPHPIAHSETPPTALSNNLRVMHVEIGAVVAGQKSETPIVMPQFNFPCPRPCCPFTRRRETGRNHNPALNYAAGATPQLPSAEQPRPC